MSVIALFVRSTRVVAKVARHLRRDPLVLVGLHGFTASY